MTSINWKWREPHPINLSEELHKQYSATPFIADALINRGISTLEQASSFLNPKLHKQSSFTEFHDISKATHRINRAIIEGDLIGVWGDFDVDGQTATALVVTCLKNLGARVTHHIPVRADEGHGISLAGLRTLLGIGVRLLITCDTGITANEAVDVATQNKVDVIITDHHIIPERLPSAMAIINPNVLPVTHPLHYLSGVGTAFQLGRALYESNSYENDATDLLDLVALGTIADLAELNLENRFLVQAGLEELRQNKRIGLQELYALAHLDPAHMREEHISYLIAPRMNAIGRLKDANVMVEFLTTQDGQRAKIIALDLEELNGQRQLAVNQIYKAAQFQIDSNPSIIEEPIIVLSQKGWEAGVIGIVASRIVEKYQKPALVFSIDDTDVARGSARSIRGVDITQIISEQKELLLSFGGHPMAAGLSLHSHSLKKFIKGLCKSIRRTQPTTTNEKELMIDSNFPITSVDQETVKNIELFAPFGNGNPPIILASYDLMIIKKTTFGKSSEHLIIRVEDQEGKTADVVYWQGGNEELPNDHFDLAYTARSSNFTGGNGIQLEWIASRPKTTTELLFSTKRKYIVRDFRKISEWAQLLEITNKHPEISIWAECVEDLSKTFSHRLQIPPGRLLAVGVVPPHQDVLSHVLKRCQPEEVFLFGIRPNTDVLQNFLNRLSGLLRFAIRSKDGIVTLDELAALTSQTEKCVKLGIDYLISRGSISLLGVQNDLIKLNLGGSEDKKISDSLLVDLKIILKESASFRAYYLRAEPDSILF